MSSVPASLAPPALAAGPVPPAGLARAAEWATQALDRLQRRLAPAPAFMIGQLTSALVSARAVPAAVELGIPDALASGPPQTLEALASATDTQPDALARLLRVLVAEGIVKRTR